MNKSQHALVIGVLIALGATAFRFTGRPSPAAPPATPAEREALHRFGALSSVGQLPPADRAPAALAISLIVARPEGKGVDPDQIRLLGVERAAAGTRLRLGQAVDRVPVFDSDIEMVLDGDQRVVRLSGNLRPAMNVNTVPSLTRASAVSRAIDAVSCLDCSPAAAQSWLVVLPHLGTDHLAWRVWPRVGKDGVESQPMVFIDAHSGEVLWTCALGDDPACFDDKR